MVFFESKLNLPNFSPYLKRERLFAELEKQLNCSLICLTSDGGYGKTTLVSSFIKERNLPYIWYELSHLDRDPQTFLSYIKLAMSRQVPGKPAASDLDPEHMDDEINGILSDLSTWPTRLIIVLDNYQAIGQNEQIEELLKGMIAYASPAVTFIITSRVRPNLNLIHLRLKNRLAEFNTEQLAFTKEEIYQYFSHLHQIQLQEHELELVHEKTEGWVASLQLLQDLLKNMNMDNRLSFWLTFKGTPEIYEYLGSVVLRSETEQIKSFLYKTCILSELHPDIINEYLGIDNAAFILKYIQKNHLFVYRTTSGDMKYHSIFRLFLYDELTKNISKSDIAKMHSELSRIYESKQQFFNAFAHSLAGQNFHTAARLMGKMKEMYNSTRFLILIDGLLEQIAPNFSAVSISFFLFRCIPFAILNGFIQPLEENIGRIQGKNPMLLAQLRLQLAIIYYYTGDINKSFNLSNQSLDWALKNEHHEMIYINYSLQSSIYRHMGHLEKAKSVAQDILAYPDNGNFHLHHRALWLLAELHLELKRVDEAEDLIKETFKFAEQSQRQDGLIYSYCLWGKYYRLQGDYDQALHWLKKAEESGLRYNIYTDLGHLYKEMSITYAELNQLREALYYIEKAVGLYRFSSYFSAVVKSIQISILEKMGETARASEIRKEYADICRDKNYDWLISEEPKPAGGHRPIAAVSGEEPRQAVPMLHISALGKFRINYGDQIVAINRKSSLQLLHYFITNRNRKIPKDMLLEAIFPEGGTVESVNNRFYVALSYLRKKLEPDMQSGKDSMFIKREGEHYMLSAEHIALDIDAFQELLEERKGMTEEERIRRLTEAEAMYKGDYLEEYPYIEFLELYRERLRFYYLNLLRELANYHWEQHYYDKGMHYFDKIIEKEPYKEIVYEEYIEKLLEASLFLHAKKVSKLYEKYIGNELGVPVQNKLNSMFRKYSI